MNSSPSSPSPDDPRDAPDPPEVAPQQRLAFLNLDQADAERLRAMLPEFRRWADDFVEVFYRHLFSFAETSRLLQSPATVSWLREAQKRHFETMLEAVWDENYFRQRRRVGQTHAEVGLEPQYFLGAYNQYIDYSLERLAEQSGGDVHAYQRQVASLLKAILFDIGLTLDAYFAQSTSNLRHALDMFWQANSELRQFAQLTSHDLKTPLATVANLCDEALDEFSEQLPDPARQLIEKAKNRTFRMSHMIDELLANAVAESDGQIVGETSSQEALDEAVELLRPELEQNRIEVTVPKPLPWVQASKLRLREVFQNLLSNAAKFIDRRPGKVTVECYRQGNRCVIVVGDNGPGIPADETERIFSPFRRLPVHRDRPGSGLGLYFTKNLVSQFGGRIWVESEPGQGSRFHIELAAAAEHSA